MSRIRAPFESSENTGYTSAGRFVKASPRGVWFLLNERVRSSISKSTVSSSPVRYPSVYTNERRLCHTPPLSETTTQNGTTNKMELQIVSEYVHTHRMWWTHNQPFDASLKKIELRECKFVSGPAYPWWNEQKDVFAQRIWEWVRSAKELSKWIDLLRKIIMFICLFVCFFSLTSCWHPLQYEYWVERCLRILLCARL